MQVKTRADVLSEAAYASQVQGGSPAGEPASYLHLDPGASANGAADGVPTTALSTGAAAAALRPGDASQPHASSATQSLGASLSRAWGAATRALTPGAPPGVARASSSSAAATHPGGGAPPARHVEIDMVPQGAGGGPHPPPPAPSPRRSMSGRTQSGAGGPAQQQQQQPQRWRSGWYPFGGGGGSGGRSSPGGGPAAAPARAPSRRSGRSPEAAPHHQHRGGGGPPVSPTTGSITPHTPPTGGSPAQQHWCRPGSASNLCYAHEEGLGGVGGTTTADRPLYRFRLPGVDALVLSPDQEVLHFARKEADARRDEALAAAASAAVAASCAAASAAAAAHAALSVASDGAAGGDGGVAAVGASGAAAAGHVRLSRAGTGTRTAVDGAVAAAALLAAGEEGQGTAAPAARALPND